LTKNFKKVTSKPVKRSRLYFLQNLC
jgi:hypothetical protein